MLYVKQVDIPTYSKQLKILTTWKGFSVPQEILRRPDGSVVVAEMGTGRLLWVEPNGVLRTPVVEALEGPLGLAPAGDHAVYVTEWHGGKLSRVDLNTGTRTVLLKGLAEPEGIDILPDGRVALVEVGFKRILLVDPKTRGYHVIASGLPIGFRALRQVECGAWSQPKGTPWSGWTPCSLSCSAKGDIYFTSDIETAVYRLRRIGGD